MYYAYTNLSCEGVVVVKDDDKKFPIGYNPYDGTIAYVDSLSEALRLSTLLKESDDIFEAVRFDSAGYPRYPSDLEEGAVYNKLLTIEWNKPLLVI